MQEGLTLDQPADKAPSWPAVMSKSFYGQYRRTRFGRGSAPMVTKWIATGKIAPPALRSDGKIDRVLADAQLKASLDATRLGEATAEDDEEDDAAEIPAAPQSINGVGSVAQEQAALAYARRKKLELETAELEGRLVDKSEVVGQAFDAARLLRDRIMGVPPKIAGVLAGMTDEKEIAAALRRELGLALNATAEDLESKKDAA